MLEISPEAQQELTQTESTESTDQSTQSTEATQEMKEILELDKVEKFKFHGKEWSPKDFTSAYMRNADYSKKMQEISEERKFMDALPHDIKKIKESQNFDQISAEFKRVYPEKFHWVIEQFKPALSPDQTGAKPQASPVALPPELEAKLGKLDHVLADYEERQIKAAEAELDSIFQKHSAKYPYADESKVTLYAQSMLDRGEKLTDATWEKIFQHVQKQGEETYKRWQTESLKKQSEANSRGKDTGSGGGIPGQAPRSHRTLKEAQEAILQSMSNGMTLEN